MCRVALNQKIKFISPNPKDPSGSLHQRYARYMKATTIGQALKLGAATGDFEFDLRKGFEDCEKFGTPFQYEHKQGAVIWVDV